MYSFSGFGGEKAPELAALLVELEDVEAVFLWPFDLTGVSFEMKVEVLERR